MNFWDYSAWTVIVQFGIILAAVLIGNILRRKVKFIKNSLLPSSVLAGLLIFLLKFIPGFQKLINSDFMSILTYHFLALGFIALTLKTTAKAKDQNKLVIMDSGIITVNGYLVQGIVGIIISVVLSLTLFSNLFYAAGLLLPMGFGQGTGQALNIGKVLEGFGFENGTTFGLSIAAIGFFVACIVGVIYMNILKKKGKLKLQEERKEEAAKLDNKIFAENEAPLNESLDKLTMQIALVFVTYIITYLVILGLSELSVNFLGNFGTNTLRPLFWGFNFLFGALFAMLIKKFIAFLKKKNIMKHEYVNNFMMNRLSGFFFDVMIVSGMAAIDYQNLKGLWIPLILICAVGALVTFFYLKFICKKIYPGYEYEAFFSFFGMLTGTASTGMILLREIDPNFETPAADNLVYQQVPAIIFGAPILLLITFGSKSLTQCLILLGILSGMFIVYNIILLRKYIFKKKNKKAEEKVIDSK